MRLGAVRTELSALGLTIRKTEEGEYRVNYRGASERYAYYTGDLTDALDTGRAMHANRPEIIKPDLRINR